MRVQLATVKARKGQRVRLHASMRAGMKNAFCEVFSSVGGADPSPHIAIEMFEVVRKDGPSMFNATTIRLSETIPARSLELIADEDCVFHLMQDIDVRGDALVKAKVETYGKFKEFLAATRRWFLGNFGRRNRGDNAKAVNHT